MHKAVLGIPGILQQLESLYGNQVPCWPTDPYHSLVWWHCGYPASDTACAKGWNALNEEIGVEPPQLLAAGAARLTRALKPGGMVPELRAVRLMEIASRIQDEYGGDLLAGLSGPLTRVRQALKRFPSIADPGADRIMLFGGIAPVPAVPSNCPHVIVRIQRGQEGQNYGVTYREAQLLIDAETPANFDARTRAYLLLKRHGQSLCKRSNPKCDRCPVNSSCAFFAHKHHGRPTPA
jgi:endonuclease III